METFPNFLESIYLNIVDLNLIFFKENFQSLSVYHKPIPFKIHNGDCSSR